MTNYYQIYYETQATEWGMLGCLSLLWLAKMIPLVQEGFWALALILAVATISFNPYKAVSEWSGFKSRLLQKDLKSFSLEDFLKSNDKQKTENSISLGDGFVWGKEQCQAIHDLTSGTDDGISHFLEKQTLADEKKQGTSLLHALKESQKLTLPVDDLFLHTLLVGCSGSGKTSAIIYLALQAIAKDMCVFVIDPKGDNKLFRLIQAACAYQHREFKYLRVGRLEGSTAINLLENCGNASEIASRIGRLLPSEGPNDPFRDMAETALRAVAEGLELLGEKPTLKSLYNNLINRIVFANRVMTKWLLSQNFSKENLPKGRNDRETFDALTELCNQFEEKPSELTNLIDYAKKPEELLDKTISSIKGFLSHFTTKELGNLLSPSQSNELDFTNTRKLIQRNDVFYLGTDALQDVSIASTLGAFFLTDLASTAGDIYNYEKGKKRKVLVVIDEASEVCCDALIALLSKARGAGIGLLLATQSLEDFTSRLGSEAEKNRVLANITNRVVMRVQDVATCEWFSGQVPSTSIKTKSRTRTISTNSNDLLLNGLVIGERENVTIGVPIVSSDLYIRLPKGEAFATIQGGRIYKIRIPYIYEKEE